MKKLLIVIISVSLLSCKSSQTIAQTNGTNIDTLQWLQTKIAQRANYFQGKPLSVLLDSLYNLKYGIKQFTPPIISDDAPAHTRPGDTIRTRKLILYFNDVFGGGYISQLHDVTPSINTHVPYLYIEFTNSIAFASVILDNLRPVWNWLPVEYICRPNIVYKVEVGEY